MHKLSMDKSENSLCWWPLVEERKNIVVKKEEQSTPLDIKVEEPLTPNLLYHSDPPLDTSHPNNFENWGDIATA